jgi:hypothetical protein
MVEPPPAADGAARIANNEASARGHEVPDESALTLTGARATSALAGVAEDAAMTSRLI